MQEYGPKYTNRSWFSARTFRSVDNFYNELLIRVERSIGETQRLIEALSSRGLRAVIQQPNILTWKEPKR